MHISDIRYLTSLHEGVPHEDSDCNIGVSGAVHLACSRSTSVRCLAIPLHGAYAQQYSPYASYGRYYGLRIPYDVYDTRGRYIDSDPDPRIRDQLARDPPNAIDALR